jgi:hypothetical protein
VEIKGSEWGELELSILFWERSKFIDKIILYMFGGKGEVGDRIVFRHDNISYSGNKPWVDHVECRDRNLGVLEETRWHA